MVKAIMSFAKKQHWVPRFYLKEFAIEETKNSKNPQVWIFSKYEGDPVRVGIKDIAAKRFLYSPKSSDGSRSWEMEEKLAKMESYVSQLWPHICDEYFDLDDPSIRKILSLFISTMILRHPGKIDIVKSFHKQFVNLVATAPIDRHGNPDISEIKLTNGKTIPFDSSSWPEYRDSTDNDLQAAFVDQIGLDALHIAEVLREKRWSLLKSKNPLFITSDQPVSMVNQDRDRFGIATKGTIMHFPMSPNQILVMDDMHHEPSSQLYELADTGPGAANYMTWINAHNFMITSRHPDTVSAEFFEMIDTLEQKGYM